MARAVHRQLVLIRAGAVGDTVLVLIGLPTDQHHGTLNAMNPGIWNLKRNQFERNFEFRILELSIFLNSYFNKFMEAVTTL